MLNKDFFSSFLSGRQLKVFLISFMGAFLMGVLPHLGLRDFLIKNNLNLDAPQIVRSDVFLTVEPKLRVKPTPFEITKTNSLFSLSGLDQAFAYGIVDFNTGQVLAAKNFTNKLPIASLTKLMTAVVALDLAAPDEVFAVSFTASKLQPTKIMLKEGEKLTLEQLLNSLLISSANDSAQVIKEGIDKKYGGEVFIKAMNVKAKLIGLEKSHFTNPHGLDDPENYSTIEDLIMLSHYVLTNYPLISQIVAKDHEDYNKGSETRFYLNNWNGLLGVYPGVLGVKIGNTSKAGYTTIVVSERLDKKMLAVVLGAPGVYERDLWASKLLDFGFTTTGLPAINVTREQLKAKYASWKIGL